MRDNILTLLCFHSILSTPSWLSEAQENDKLFVDDFFEAATDNEESEVSERPERPKCSIFWWDPETQVLHFLLGPGGSFSLPWPVLLMGWGGGGAERGA